MTENKIPVDPSTEETSLTEQIATLVRTIWRLGKLGPDQRVNKVNRLTMEQYEMLLFLYDSGPQSVKYIAAHVGTTSSPVTISMKRLERANLVKRVRDTSDERVVTVHLTEQGKKVFEARRLERIKVLMSLFNSLDLEEKYQLKALLEKVLANSQAVTAAASERKTIADN